MTMAPVLPPSATQFQSTLRVQSRHSKYLAMLGDHQHLILDVQHAPEGYWLATHPDILVFGTGDAPVEAVQEFVELARDLQRELHDSVDELAPHLMHDLVILNETFGPLGD